MQHKIAKATYISRENWCNVTSPIFNILLNDNKLYIITKKNKIKIKTKLFFSLYKTSIN